MTKQPIFSDDATTTIVVFVGSKGGTLKSSLTATLQHVLADRGYDATSVDLDPQATLTRRSGHLRPERPLCELPVQVRYRLPASLEGRCEEVPVAGATSLLRGSRALEAASPIEISHHLRRVLASAESGAPAFVLVDTPPALGPITQAAMRAASIIVVPADATQDGMDGVKDVLELHRHMGLPTPIHVLLTRTIWLTRELAESVRQALDLEAAACDRPGLRMRTEIPYSRAGCEASVHCLPVTVSAPRDPASVAFRRLATEIGDRLGLKIRRRRRRVVRT